MEPETVGTTPIVPLLLDPVVPLIILLPPLMVKLEPLLKFPLESVKVPKIVNEEDKIRLIPAFGLTVKLFNCEILEGSVISLELF